MNRTTKAAILACSLICSASAAFAAPDVALQNQIGADFGDIDYMGGITGSVQMGTNGAITYSSGFAGSGVGVAGQFTINAGGKGKNSPYSVTCNDTNAAISNGAGSVIPIQAEIAVNSALRGAWGTGFQCDGLTSYPNLLGASRDIYIGTQLNITSPLTGGGTYSTANPGGTPFNFTVVFQ